MLTGDQYRGSLYTAGGKNSSSDGWNLRKNKRQIFTAWFLDGCFHRGKFKTLYNHRELPLKRKVRSYFPQHFLYFLPLPHGQASLRPATFWLLAGSWARSSPPPRLKTSFLLCISSSISSISSPS